MQVGVTNSYPNPNSYYFNSKGIWLTYIIVVAILHYIFNSLPFLTVAMAWTLTNVVHNLVNLFMDCINKQLLMFDYIKKISFLKYLINVLFLRI